MKSSKSLSPGMLALGLLLACLVMPLGTVHAQAVVDSEVAEGSIELGNTSGPDAGQEPVAATPETAEVAASAKANPTEVEPPKDPRELHRDRVMQVPEVMPAGTTAASRRYKKVDLATYRALMQNNAAPPAQ